MLRRAMIGMGLLLGSAALLQTPAAHAQQGPAPLKDHTAESYREWWRGYESSSRERVLLEVGSGREWRATPEGLKGRTIALVLTRQGINDANFGGRIIECIDRFSMGPDGDSVHVKDAANECAAAIEEGRLAKLYATFEKPFGGSDKADVPATPLGGTEPPTSTIHIVSAPSPSRLTETLQNLRATKIGRFVQQGEVSAALMQVVDIDREMGDYDFSTGNGGCDVRACSGLGLVILAYTRIGGAPSSASVTLIAPDGRKVESGGGMSEADSEEMGWDSSRALLSSDVFRVDGLTATEILQSGGWQAEAVIGAQRFVFPLTGEGNANAHEGHALCCATLVDVAADDVLNVRAAPDASSERVASLAPGQPSRIEVLDCFGSLSRSSWQSTIPSTNGQTWCLVRVASLGAAFSNYGWANARYLRFRADP